MTVHCPHCTTGYELPAHLIGPAGARVRCPRCRTSFHVAPPGAPPVMAGGIVSVSAVASPPAWAAEPPAPRREVDGPAVRRPQADDDSALAVATEPEPGPDPATAAAPADPHAIACDVVERWLERDGDAVIRARVARRLFRDHGPALFAAFDAYRMRAGAAAPAAAFRAALHLRLGLALN
jgi:predicted Zn finger-like uncharacterized protein